MWNSNAKDFLRLKVGILWLLIVAYRDIIGTSENTVYSESFDDADHIYLPYFEGVARWNHKFLGRLLLSYKQKAAVT